MGCGNRILRHCLNQFNCFSILSLFVISFFYFFFFFFFFLLFFFYRWFSNY
jgi:hypothetical protein